MLTQDALLCVLTPFEPLADMRCYNFKRTTLSNQQEKMTEPMRRRCEWATKRS